jgi:hypothetical protein
MPFESQFAAFAALVWSSWGATPAEAPARWWGEAGHRLTAQAAAARLPADMPAFFTEAAPQLVYLNPEPDRWRANVERALDPALEGATAPDHFLDYELIPAGSRAGALAARDRYAFADTLRAHGVSPATTGALPFAILEVTQRMRVAFRDWRAAPNDQVRKWIEARILNDAGELGHYVADGSNPAHTTIHYNGWVGPNPNGYATDTRFHSRFESAYVQAQLRLTDVLPGVAADAQTLTQLRPAVIAYLLRTHAEVETLYRLDKADPFSAQNTNAGHKAFAATRLSAGATMLRDLWYTAYVTSAPEMPTAAPGR